MTGNPPGGGAGADLDDLRRRCRWIFPESTSGLALHQRAGFRIVGTRDRLHGRWRDMVLVERRSPTII